jgi:L,D-transpeptidase catalytic domain
MIELSPDRTRGACGSLRHRRPIGPASGIIGALGLICALTASALPAAARDKAGVKAQLKKETEHVRKEPFGNIPNGPLHIIISVDQQTLHLYSDGVPVADALVATGVPEHPTPLGVFSVVGKELYHESNIYSSAPMPYMQRITWSGVAIHQGVGVGHPASHGCIRIPREFAQRLWILTRLGARVIIARPELKPEDIADPHLFSRKLVQPASTAMGAAADVVKTAQTADDRKTTDVGAGAMPADPPGAPAAAGSNTDSAGEGAAKSGTPAPVPAAADVLRPAIEAAPETVPLPARKPPAMASASKKVPISVFVSRKTKRIYVRQNFEPMFEAPITIERPDLPIGTHVFTAMEFLADGATFRWSVVSLPGDPPKAPRASESKVGSGAKDKRRGEAAAEPAAETAVQTPREALARIDIPQDVSDQIAALIVPGSSLVVSDQGLGEETGEGTDFIVLTPPVTPVAPSSRAQEKARAERRAENAGHRAAHTHHPRRSSASAPEL